MLLNYSGHQWGEIWFYKLFPEHAGRFPYGVLYGNYPTEMIFTFPHDFISLSLIMATPLNPLIP